MKRLAQFAQSIALIAILFPPGACAEPPVVVKVIDERGRGVKSELFIITSKSEPVRIGMTDEKGIFRGDLDCTRGCRLKVKPRSAQYFYNDRVECPLKSTNDVQVTSKQFFGQLKNDASSAVAKGDLALGAGRFKEAAALARQWDGAEGERLGQRSIESYGKLLGIERPTAWDDRQGKLVPTIEMRKAIEKVQADKGEKVTGKIDNSFSRAVGKETLGSYMEKSNAERSGNKNLKMKP